MLTLHGCGGEQAEPRHEPQQEPARPSEPSREPDDDRELVPA